MSMKFRLAVVYGALFLSVLAPRAAGAGETLDIMQDCMIQPSSVVNVGSEVTGIIEELLVDRGDYVKKGQIIVKLNSGVEQATMESRKARYEFALRDHQRKAELYAKQFIAAADVDQAETNLKISQRDYEEAKEVLERRIIRSPVDGVVMQRMLEAGARVEAEPIMKLAQVSPLYAEVIAPAGMLGSVKVGDAVAVKPEIPVTRNRYIGHVKIVDTVVDAASGTFGIRIEIENNDHSLPAGLKCKAQFQRKQKTQKTADTKKMSRITPSASPGKTPTP